MGLWVDILNAANTSSQAIFSFVLPIPFQWFWIEKFLFAWNVCTYSVLCSHSTHTHTGVPCSLLSCHSCDQRWHIIPFQRFEENPQSHSNATRLAMNCLPQVPYLPTLSPSGCHWRGKLFIERPSLETKRPTSGQDVWVSGTIPSRQMDGALPFHKVAENIVSWLCPNCFSKNGVIVQYCYSCEREEPGNTVTLDT